MDWKPLTVLLCVAIGCDAEKPCIQAADLALEHEGYWCQEHCYPVCGQAYEAVELNCTAGDCASLASAVVEACVTSCDFHCPELLAVDHELVAGSCG